MKRLTFIFLSTLSIATHSLADAATHPFNWDDLFSMVRLSSPMPSPDGKWVLFSRTEYDVEKNKGNTDLAIVSTDGKNLRRLTFDPAGDSNGRWTADSSGIFFLSSRTKNNQIYKLSLNGGEPEKITNLPVDIDGFEISPSGKKVLFWAAVFPDCKDLACTADRAKKMDESKVRATLFTTIPIRHWDSWSDGRRNHLFVMDLADQKPVDLTAGWDQDAPTKPFGGNEETSWSPDSTTIAFVSKPSKGEAWTTNNEIYLVSSDGKGKPRCITEENAALDAAPAFSPDGKTLAYLAMERPGYESDKLHIVLHDLKTDKKRHLTKGWDRSVDGLVWSGDSSSLYAVVLDQGRNKIFSIDVAKGEPRIRVGEGNNSSVQVTSEGKLIFLKDRLTSPNEIFSYDVKSGETTQVSHVNEDKLSRIRFGAAEEFWFENDGRKLRGWLIKPVDFKAGKKYPLAFLIHGGPQGSWLDNFHYRWSAQFYAGAGYAVIAIDFRGSTGYGQAFTDAIRTNWGPGPYSDLMTGLSFALKNHSFIDSSRMCALGASFGGYMANWMAGQEQPFKCLVNHDGDFDTTSAYYSTEELWFPEWEMTGTPWEQAQIYEKNSPMKFVSKWKTPMLVIHGGQDFRVSESEGFATFNALQRKEIPSKMLYFPDENHWVRKPQNSRLWHKTVLGWVDQWTGTKR